MSLSTDIIDKVTGVMKQVENPYSTDVHLDHGTYDGLYRKVFEEARQAFIKAIKEG